MHFSSHIAWNFYSVWLQQYSVFHHALSVLKIFYHHKQLLFQYSWGKYGPRYVALSTLLTSGQFIAHFKKVHRIDSTPHLQTYRTNPPKYLLLVQYLLNANSHVHFFLTSTLAVSKCNLLFSTGCILSLKQCNMHTTNTGLSLLLVNLHISRSCSWSSGTEYHKSWIRSLCLQTWLV